MKKGIVFIAVIALPLYILAQLSPAIDSIPMRDGKKLAADIYLPDTAGGMTYATILIQTPYNRTAYRHWLPLGIGLNVLNLHFAIVIVDWRCFYGSHSACVANPDRGNDGFDVVEWIASRSWSDGKVGTWGASALGKIQFETAKKRPPHLVCCAPLVAGPQFDYSEYYPGGVFRTEYVEQLDALGYGLSTFILAHPCHDITWQYVENANMYPDSISVPMLMIGGWYDHNTDLMLEFFYKLTRESDTSVRHKHKLVMGPWCHEGVGRLQQGELSYPQALGVSDTLAMDFFEYHLLGAHNGWPARPLIRYFQMGENTWKFIDTLSFDDVTNVRLFLKSNGLLEKAAPASMGECNSFDYDPRDPSPTHGGATLRSDLLQGPYDQAALVESRNDIITFSTPSLSANTVLKGKVKVRLFISSGRKDTDFAIRLTDVYPNNSSYLLAEGITRMRFRNGFSTSDTAVMTPGEIYPVDIELPATCNTFLAGHKIRIDVTSSNFPRFDRNLNNGLRMYVPGDTLSGDNTVYTNSDNASYVDLPLVSYTENIEAPLSCEPFRIGLYPNPASNYINISINSNSRSLMNIHVLDMNGKEVMNTMESIEKGNEHFRLNVSGLQPGIYIAKFTDEKNFTVMKKFTVLR